MRPIQRIISVGFATAAFAAAALPALSINTWSENDLYWYPGAIGVAAQDARLAIRSEALRDAVASADTDSPLQKRR